MATKVSRGRSTSKSKQTMAAAKGGPKAARPAGRVARFEHQLAVALQGAARETGAMVKGLGHDASLASRKLVRAVSNRLKVVRPPARAQAAKEPRRAR